MMSQGILLYSANLENDLYNTQLLSKAMLPEDKGLVLPV